MIGNDGIYDSLLTLSESGIKIKDRKIVVNKYEKVSDVGYCHIIYISPGKKDEIPAVLDALKGKAILTISMVRGFNQMGGIINFVIINNNLRFEINNDAAIQKGLMISSKLLNLSLHTMKYKDFHINSN